MHRRSGGGAGRVRATWRDRRPFCASTSCRTSRTRRTERQSAFMARCRSAVTRGVRISCVSRSGAALWPASHNSATRSCRSGCPSRGSTPPRGNRGRRRRGRVRAPVKAPAHLAGRRLRDGPGTGRSPAPGPTARGFRRPHAGRSIHALQRAWTAGGTSARSAPPLRGPLVNDHPKPSCLQRRPRIQICLRRMLAPRCHSRGRPRRSPPMLPDRRGDLRSDWMNRVSLNARATYAPTSTCSAPTRTPHHLTSAQEPLHAQRTG